MKNSGREISFSITIPSISQCVHIAL